jgi:tRNA threonylcarbamoyladenosine biosynthesis protein TsaB
MNVLALDAASPMPAVAFTTPSGVWEERLALDRRASEELLAVVGRVLERAGTDLSACRRIVVFSGPGSFTGTRVGLATAWGLGRALEIPVESISTLEALAETTRSEGASQVVTALDAGRGEILVQAFRLDGPRAQPIAAIERLPLAEAVARFAAVRVVSLPADLLGQPGPQPPESPARAAALAAARAPREGAGPTAVYARPSAAEEKLGAP